MTIHEFFVRGVPGPQGSKVRTRYGMREASALVQPWREAVVSQIMRVSLNDLRLDGPLYAEIVFWFERPKSHFRTGKFAHELRPDAPIYVTKPPDIDKLQRSTYDALTQSGMIVDDSRIVANYNEKRYCDQNQRTPGALIKVKQIGS